MRFTLKNPRSLQYIDYQNVRKTEFLGCQSQEILHSTHFVHQNALWCTNRFLHPVPYLGSPFCVPTMPLIPFRTSESPPVYQPCPPSRSVPQVPLPCTNYAPDPVPYLRSPSCVPTVPLTPFRTAEAPPVYQPCPSPRFVPRINLF